jgi:hypothetical protein
LVGDEIYEERSNLYNRIGGIEELDIAKKLRSILIIFDFMDDRLA